MTQPLEGRLIFIASPSGLEVERETVRTVIANFNKMNCLTNGIIFVYQGWEELPPGVGRAQSQINATLDRCDFLLVLLADKWGSPPGGTNYSSGTEEEFMRAVSNLADAQMHMRDIHVYFRSVGADRMADPGPELSKVLTFKKKLEESHGILHGGTFDSTSSLATKIEGSLRKWSLALGVKEPLTIDLGSESEIATETDDSLLESALQAADAGRVVQAEILFAKASQTGDINAIVESARFARRRGLLDDAIELNNQVVAMLSPRGDRTAEQSALLVGALANIGVAYRKKGDLSRSIRALEEAIEIGRAAPQPSFNEIAYALDNLGHSFGQTGQNEKAREAFEKAIEERQAGGEDHVALTSRLNLGWLALRTGDTESALELFAEAEDDARAADQASLANCLAGRGDALLRLGRPPEAVPFLKEALAVNIAISNSDGIGISSGLLARAYAATNELDSAEAAVRQTLDESESSGSSVGLATGYWGRALISAARGQYEQAQVDFEEALRLAGATGNASLLRAIKQSQSETRDA